MSNFQKMSGWLQEIRVDIDASARYLAMEDSFVKVAEEGVGNAKSHIFKMPGMKKVLLDNFMEARNNGMLWNKSTMDENGRCMLHDRQGRDLICGDGLIAQISRYCGKTNYAKLSTSILTGMISDLVEKCENPMGNQLTFVVNQILFNQLQQVCGEFLMRNKVMGQHLYSKFEKDMIKVGATYSAFEWAGNTISFLVDRALSVEYSKGGYGVMIDLTSDAASGAANLQAVTLKGKQMVQNNLDGVGVKDGSVATPVAGQKYMVSGYAGLMCSNPYRCHILIQNV